MEEYSCSFVSHVKQIKIFKSDVIFLSDLLEKGVTINLDPNERKINYDCYENEFFDKPSQKDNYERGAPGELSFAEISKKMTKVDKEGKLKKVVVKEGYGAKVSSGIYLFTIMHISYLFNKRCIRIF